MRFGELSPGSYGYLQHSDALYIAAIIAGLTRSLTPLRMPEVSELSHTVWQPELDDEDRDVLELAKEEVDRYREMDRLNPSPHNVVSIVILEVCCAHSPTSKFI